MKISTLVVLLLNLVLLSCSSDDTTEEETMSVGNLVVNVVTPDGDPEANAEVILMPGNMRQVTNANGEANYTNLSVGVYEGVVEPSINSSFYVEGLAYSFENITIVNNETETVTIELLEAPDPIGETDINIDLLLADTYDKLKDDFMFGNYLQYWGDIGADIAYVRNTAPPTLLSLDRYDISPSNSIIREVWAAHYTTIRNTNVAIEAIEDASYTSESGKTESEIFGEFRFLRALCYFNLLKIYGNPVLVESTDIDTPLIQDRSGVKALIEADLEYAEMNLNEFQSSKIASKQAAQALLGKFYLYSAGFPDFDFGNYSLAAEQFEKLMSSFSLEEDYSGVFDVAKEATNSEIIFSIDFDASETEGGSSFGFFWGPKGYADEDYLLLDSKFTAQYFDDENDFVNPISFPLSIDDERFYTNIASFIVEGGVAVDATNTDDWRPLKYLTDITVQPEVNASESDFPYLRYADVLLMLAEVENALNGPTVKSYDLVNQVIARSSSSENTQLSSGLSQSDFLLEILEQRQKELFFEGQNKDDLIRNDLLQDIITDFNARNPSLAKQYESHEYIWPIPQSEVNSNPNITQNVGY